MDRSLPYFWSGLLILGTPDALKSIDYQPTQSFAILFAGLFMLSDSHRMDICKKSKTRFNEFHLYHLTTSVFALFVLGQVTYTVPTVITVENSAYTAPVFNANLAITMLEDFGNPRRPVQTKVGQYTTDNEGNVVVSLMPNKDYAVIAEVDGFYTQISKISTRVFSRTKVNKKGISLRPRFVHAIQGNVKMTSSLRLDGLVSCKNLYSGHIENYPMDAEGRFLVKAVSGYDYELRVVVDGILDTLITYSKIDLVGTSTEEPLQLSIDVDYDFPNHSKGSMLKLANTTFVGRTTALYQTNWIDTLSDILAKYPRVRVKMNVYTDARKSIEKIISSPRLVLPSYSNSYEREM